jgi:hypothetical protein
MSIHHSTTNSSKSKTLFLPSLLIRYGRIIWPKGMPYSSWQNLLKRCPIINSKKRPKKRSSHGCRKFLNENEHQSDEIMETHIEKIIDMPKCSEQPHNKDIKLELITMLKHFLDRKLIFQHIEKIIPDKRSQDLITYPKGAIMKAALAIFLFREGSGNKFNDDSRGDDEKYSRANMAKFIDAPENCVPVIKTIETFIQNLDKQSINNLMIAFFKDLQESKFFKQHSQIMPGDYFLLAADCVHTHTYDHPHHVDENGENDCDCCLKRVYNKGTEKEKTRWLHSVLVFSFIFECGLKLPIYSHPIRAKQVVGFETAPEDSHKQECELVALKFTLPIIRDAFPRMKIVLLLDGLYANRPVLRLAEEYKCGYIIVRKEGCLTLLAKDCDEQAATSNHKKNCVKQCRRVNFQKWCIEQKHVWFNSRYLGEGVSTNVLRFLETRTKEGEETKTYKCEWLFSWRLSAKTCELAARQARLRWEIEDLFNSIKNRGNNLKHDYSRNPRSCFNWQGLSLLAFGIFELFRFSEAVTQRGDWPQRTLAHKLLSQLLQRPTIEIFSEECLSMKIQFRYHFVVEMIKSNEIPQKEVKKELKTG